MIIILDDDPVYLSWIRRHPRGFVLDTRRKPTQRNTTLHRAKCRLIRHSKTRRTHWTTGIRMKACSQQMAELVAWIAEQTGCPPMMCTECGQATRAAPENGHATRHLTRLGEEILSCVVESAVIHLDNNLPYDLTVADIAHYLTKTPAQISSALSRLVDEQMIFVEGDLNPEARIVATSRVLPTAAALQALPAFEVLSPNDLADELDALKAIENGATDT